MGNQKPHIEGQTVQSLKQKAQNNKQQSTQKTKDSAAQTSETEFSS